MNKNPILVTGAHRSGTTWIGNMLSQEPGMAYIHEPFNPIRSFRTDVKPGVCTAEFKYWFTYINKHNEDKYLHDIDRTLNYQYGLISGLKAVHSFEDYKDLLQIYIRSFTLRKKNTRPLIKDPIAIFSTEWLAMRYDMNVIILIRHPAAFANSLLQHNFFHPFSHFILQPELMEEKLAPFQDEIISHAQSIKDILNQAILLWRIIYYTVYQYQTKFPEWIFIRYEDITASPVTEIKQICENTNIRYTKKLEQRIIQQFKPNAYGWKRTLSKKQIETIKAETSDIWKYYYSRSEW